MNEQWQQINMLLDWKEEGCCVVVGLEYVDEVCDGSAWQLGPGRPKSIALQGAVDIQPHPSAAAECRERKCSLGLKCNYCCCACWCSIPGWR